MIEVFLGIAFVQGILTFLSPCMLPILPIYTGYVISAGKRKYALLHSFCIIAGFTTIFLVLGSIAGVFGYILNDYHTIFKIVSGIFLIGFGIFIGLNAAHKHCHNYVMGVRPTIAKSYGMGVMLALSGEPCIVAFVSSTLIAAGNMQNPASGAWTLFIYSLGLGLPFIVCAFFFNRLSAAWEKLHKYENLTKWVSVAVLVGVGIVFVTDPLWHDHSSHEHTVGEGTKNVEQHIANDDTNAHEHEHTD